MLTELVNYDYYKNVYGGSSIPESSFKNKSIEASSRVNRYTYKRINDNNIDNNIRNATCEIADFIYSQEILKEKILTGDNQVKASETVGPHSISYVNKINIQEKHILSINELDRECYLICSKYLINTGLMDRGVYRCFHTQ